MPAPPASGSKRDVPFQGGNVILFPQPNLGPQSGRAPRQALRVVATRASTPSGAARTTVGGAPVARLRVPMISLDQALADLLSVQASVDLAVEMLAEARRRRPGAAREAQAQAALLQVGEMLDRTDMAICKGRL